MISSYLDYFNNVLAEIFERLEECSLASSASTKERGKLITGLIATRCGSTYLTSLLNNLSKNELIAGEFFSPQWIEFAKESRGWNYTDILLKLVACQQNGFSVFNKISYFHFTQLCSDNKDFKKYFFSSDQFYRIKRRDIRAQINSRYRAKISGEWHQFPSDSNMKASQINDNIEDLYKLMESIIFTIGSEYGWDTYLEENKAQFANKISETYYEHIIENSLGIVNHIQDLMGIKESKSLSDCNGLPQRIGKKTSPHLDKMLKGLLLYSTSLLKEYSQNKESISL